MKQKLDDPLISKNGYKLYVNMSNTGHFSVEGYDGWFTLEFEFCEPDGAETKPTQIFFWNIYEEESDLTKITRPLAEYIGKSLLNNDVSGILAPYTLRCWSAEDNFPEDAGEFYWTSNERTFLKFSFKGETFGINEGVREELMTLVHNLQTQILGDAIAQKNGVIDDANVSIGQYRNALQQHAMRT